MTRPVTGALGFVEGVLLALWLGAAVFFAAFVAPAAFALAPTPSFAGALVGRLLAPLFATGAVVGLAILGVELRWPRAGSRLRGAAAGVMLAACAAAQFGIGAQIERVRGAAGRPMAMLEPDDPRRVAFGRLHALSVGALGAAMVAATTAMAASRVRLARGG